MRICCRENGGGGGKKKFGTRCFLSIIFRVMQSMCSQPKHCSYKSRSLQSLPATGPIPTLFLLDLVTGNRGENGSQHIQCASLEWIKLFGKSWMEGWRDKGNDGGRQVAVCLLWTENYQTETHRGGDAQDDRLRLEPGGAGICWGRERWSWWLWHHSQGLSVRRERRLISC